MNALRKLLFILKFIEIRLRFVAILVVTALVVGYWDHVQNYYERWARQRQAGAGVMASQEEAVSSAHAGTEYYCPMHTFVVRDRPGKCPICGMTLVPRKKGEKAVLPDGVVARVQVSPERVMQGGVKVEPVRYELLAQSLSAYGEIETDETRTARIIARFPGRVEELLVRSTGASIEKGEALARIYSPRFLAASEEYAQALASRRRAESDPEASSGARTRARELADHARQRLSLAGFSEEQLDELAAHGHPDSLITLHAPLAGIVVEKSVLPGDMVEEGAPLFTVADLSTVWVQARFLESDLGLIKAGMPVTATATAFPGRNFFGTVDFIYPTVDRESRAGRVRVVLPNPDLALKPGMSVMAELRIPSGKFEKAGEGGTAAARSPAESDLYTCPMHPEVISDTPSNCPKCGMTLVKMAPKPPEEAVWVEGYTCPMHPDQLEEKEGVCSLCDCGMALERYRVERTLAVPEAAVIDTGLKKIVYVESSPGVYDARAVVLGRRAGDQYPVSEGLKAGERIVSAGAFLIDAENRLNP